MEKSLLKRLTLPVLAMLFVYYVTTDEASPASNNLIKSVNEQNSMNQSQVIETESYTVFGIHESGQVVQTQVSKGESEDSVREVFNIFTSKMNQLPLGVDSPISPATSLNNYTLDNGILTLDVSEEFLSYDVLEERKVLEALVWSFTELPEVEKVKFMVNGTPMVNLKGNLSVENGLSKTMGVNLELDTKDINDSQLVNLYFLTDDSQTSFLVPVSRLIPADVDPIEYALTQLISGPITDRYVSVFDSQVELLNKPVVEDGVISLNFNEALYYDANQSVVSALVVKQLVSTLTDFENISHVAISVNGDYSVMNNHTKTVSKLVNPIYK